MYKLIVLPVSLLMIAGCACAVPIPAEKLKPVVIKPACPELTDKQALRRCSELLR